ncbi:WG repeat-containing protein [Hymenobacter sp. BT635]|uniref:WG repeat-containing protein n=1 Tax=Hymenobacter nitidus TaxID=2880929 RepID=A0ABS8ABE2_9BACT|nr:WG repeat-containing protein [Hymenobacter nitidus]MCB2376550.1 WG repeat-containing protein [Hymenobacter nitidus]
MLHVSVLSPFTDKARQEQFEAVRAALAAEPNQPTTLLLGNWPLDEGEVLDAVVLRPHLITILLLEPRGGQLSIRDFAHAAWQLGGAPLTGKAEADNPFQQFVQQKAALAQLLTPYLPAGQANLNFISGLLLFGEAVVFGVEVEERMSAVPAANNFQLLADPSRFTRRLAQLATPEIDLTAADLEQLAAEIAPAETGSPDAPEAFDPEVDELPDAPPAPATATSFLQQKAAWLWRWLGAEDVDDLDNAPYGYAETALAARNQEKQELERVQAAMQKELAAQLRAMEAREAEREKSIAQLREQLAAAPPVAPEAALLQERLALESREKDALDVAIQASRAESEARNRELDAKIQQLEQLMQRLQNSPAPAAAAPVGAPGPVVAAAPPGPTAAATNLGPARPTTPWDFRKLRAWRRRLPRLAALGTGVVALVLVIGGVRSLLAGPPTRFEQNGQWGLLAANGDTLVPARYSAIGDFHEERAVVERAGAFGFIDEDGQEILPPTYDALNPYSGDYARVRIGDTYTFIDKEGQEFSQYYYNALDFAEGHAAVLDYRGWFYITGPEVPAEAPKLFREAYTFRGGLARVRLADGYTFISKDYLTSTKPDTKPFGRYSSASDFTDGKARVTQDGRTFYIDEDGDPVN